MAKRGMIFAVYNTAAQGWTLAPGWKLSDPKQKTNYVDKPNGDGTWDLSTALTDGVPKFSDRTLTATFELSEGNRATRNSAITNFINSYAGKRVDIQLPDDTASYITGRLHIVQNYSDLAHASVTVTAVCDPWRYAKVEKNVTLTAATSEKTTSIQNLGTRQVIPTITISGTNASVRLAFGNASRTFTAGTYQWPELLLVQGSNLLKYSGTGSVLLTYREAVL